MKKAFSVGLLTLLLTLTCAAAANADSINFGDLDELHIQATGYDKSNDHQQDWDHKDGNKDWDKDHKDRDKHKKHWDNDGKDGGEVFTGSQDLSASSVSTPEPATLSMLGLGLLGLVGIARRRLLNS